MFSCSKLSQISNPVLKSEKSWCAFVSWLRIWTSALYLRPIATPTPPSIIDSLFCVGAFWWSWYYHRLQKRSKGIAISFLCMTFCMYVCPLIRFTLFHLQKTSRAPDSLLIEDDSDRNPDFNTQFLVCGNSDPAIKHGIELAPN